MNQLPYMYWFLLVLKCEYNEGFLGKSITTYAVEEYIKYMGNTPKMMTRVLIYPITGVKQ